MPIDYVRSAHFGCLGMRPQTQSNRETKLSPGGGCYQVAATDVAKVVPFSQSISGEGRVQSAKVSEPKMENDRTTDHVSRFIILDTDMGADDAWALHLLLRAEAELKNVTLLAITCVHGNTSMNYVVRNTYRVLNALNRTDVSSLAIFIAPPKEHEVIDPSDRFQFTKVRSRHSFRAPESLLNHFMALTE